MTGNKSILEKFTGTASRDASTAAPTPPPTEPDSWDEPDGDGRTAKYGTLGIQLIEQNKKLWWIPYGALLWAEGTFNGDAIRFEVARGDVLYEVVIEGPIASLQNIVDKMGEGKRLSVRWNGTTVTRVLVRPVPKK